MNPTYAIAAETVAALRRIRELWGDLLAAIDIPPAEVWPPRQLSHTLNPEPDEPLLQRLPLTLREYPAPVNLGVLDAGRAVEEAVFALADVLAAACQRAAPGDPRRWEIRSETRPGSRGDGLHWACVWIEGRVRGEDVSPEDVLAGAPPFRPLREAEQIEARHVARTSEARLLRALGLDHRDTVIPGRPCPWCAGQLTLYTGPDIPPAVTCGTGPSCTAPVLTDDRGRRVWRWRDLPALAAALSAGASAPFANCSRITRS
ncbi:hypothetical protein AB0C11_27840 [Streptomyces sp. NPDC039016]|uniref:hypothetical protein n=1 Tax=Streptomyces sp. NPDC039016 TaxID=3154330 RepID=UPI0033CD7129